jgi:IS605 OrfB family transposase
MQHTIKAKLRDQSYDAILTKMAEQLSMARRKLFVRHGIQKIGITQLKREFIASEQITARQFNSLAYEVKSLLSSQKEIKKELIKKCQRKMKALKLKIKKSQSDFKTHQYKRKLHRTELKLKSYEKELTSPRICFGEKKLFQKQFYLEENNYKDHSEWKEAWQQARDRSFFLVGSKDESFGNQSCALLPGRLRLRLTDRLVKEHGKKYLELPIEFTYQQELISKALACGQALSYRLIKSENGYWYVHLSFELSSQSDLQTDCRYGALGIDLNPSCIALTQIDAYGNLSSSWQIPLQLKGKTSHQVEAILGEICSKIVQYARDQKIPIIVEKLDFEIKKQQLRSRGMNRMLSQFAYKEFKKLITSQCFKFAIELKEVNPAYTSVIGKVKFSLGYGLSTHMSAAMAIARRALGFGESLRAKTKYSLSLPDRNRRKHVWSDWRLINPRVFPEKYRTYWEDRLCPEHLQGENEFSSSLTRESDLARNPQSSGSKVTFH